MPLKAGISVIDITPADSVWLTGFAGRDHKSESVRDPLYIQTLVFDDGQTRLALVTLDLIGINPILQAIRDQVHQSAGIPPKNLLICCSHTHSGPKVQDFLGMGEYEETYANSLPFAIAHSVSLAIDNLTPVQLYHGVSQSNAGVIRRTVINGKAVFKPNDEVEPDRTLQLIDIRKLDGERLGCFYTFAIHPVVLNGYQISADLPGEVRRLVSEKTGVPLLFAQGCCGDVNPRLMGSESALLDLANEIAAAVFDAMANARLMISEPLACDEKNIVLPIADPPDEKAIQMELDKAQNKFIAITGNNAFMENQRAIVRGDIEYLKQKLLWLSSPPTFEIGLHLFRIGACRILGIGGEVLNGYQKLLSSSLATNPTLVIGYTDKVSNYIPLDSDFSVGGYEVEGASRWYNSPAIGFGSEAIIVSNAKSLIEFSDFSKLNLNLKSGK